MGVEIPITGIPKEFSEIEQGRVILIEGGEDLLASFLAHKIAHEYGKKGKRFVLISSRPESMVNENFAMNGQNNIDCDIYQDFNPENFSKTLTSGSLVIIDSLDYIISKKSLEQPHRTFEEIRDHCRNSGSIVIYVTRAGRLEESIDGVIKHNVDGIIQFFSNEAHERVSRQMRLIKWTNGLPYDSLIQFKYYNNEFKIDLRSKVV